MARKCLTLNHDRGMNRRKHWWRHRPRGFSEFVDMDADGADDDDSEIDFDALGGIDNIKGQEGVNGATTTT